MHITVALTPSNSVNNSPTSCWTIRPSASLSLIVLWGVTPRPVKTRVGADENVAPVSTNPFRVSVRSLTGDIKVMGWLNVPTVIFFRLL
jgi:hypothetical protein